MHYKKLEFIKHKNISSKIKKLNDQYKVNPIEILDKDKTKNYTSKELKHREKFTNPIQKDMGTDKKLEESNKKGILKNRLDMTNKQKFNNTNKSLGVFEKYNKTKAFSDYMGSKRTEHIFKSYQTAPVFVDKITNNPSNILKKSIMENRKTQPFYAKYKFQHYIVDNKNQVSFVK